MGDCSNNKTVFKLTKQMYLYIYFCSIVNFFQVVPLGYLQAYGRGFPILIFQLFWLWFGVNKYYKNENINSNKNYNLYKKTNSQFCKILYIGIAPSFFTAYSLFGQSFFQSFISDRTLLLFLAIPALLKIAPSEKDTIKALYHFSITAVGFAFVQSFGPSFLFAYTEHTEEYLEGWGDRSGDILAKGVDGYAMITIPMFYYAAKVKTNFKWIYMIKMSLLFIIIFLSQNRSTLFPSTLLIAYCVITSDMKDKRVKYFGIAFIGLILVYYFGSTFQSLLDETNEQVNSTYDPRVIAIGYFLDFQRMSIWEILFGTGNISFVTSDYVKDLQEAHIHYSDVGFIGFWSQYGILPIILFLYVLWKGISSKANKLYVKFTGITILLCGVTISYFNEIPAMTWFISFYYLSAYYGVKFKPKIRITLHKKRNYEERIGNSNTGIQGNLPSANT